MITAVSLVAVEIQNFCFEWAFLFVSDLNSELFEAILARNDKETQAEDENG